MNADLIGSGILRAENGLTYVSLARVIEVARAETNHDLDVAARIVGRLIVQIREAEEWAALRAGRAA